MNILAIRIETGKKRTNRVPRRRRPREVEDAVVIAGTMAEHVLEDGRRVAAPAELGRDGARRLEGVGLVPRLWRHNHHIAGELQRRAEAPRYLRRGRKVLRSRFGHNEVPVVFKVRRVGPGAFLNTIQVDVRLRPRTIIPKGLARQFVGLEIGLVDGEQEPPDLRALQAERRARPVVRIPVERRSRAGAGRAAGPRPRSKKPAAPRGPGAG